MPKSKLSAEVILSIILQQCSATIKSIAGRRSMRKIECCAIKPSGHQNESSLQIMSRAVARQSFCYLWLPLSTVFFFVQEKGRLLPLVAFSRESEETMRQKRAAAIIIGEWTEQPFFPLTPQSYYSGARDTWEIAQHQSFPTSLAGAVVHWISKAEEGFEPIPICIQSYGLLLDTHGRLLLPKLSSCCSICISRATYEAAFISDFTCWTKKRVPKGAATISRARRRQRQIGLFRTRCACRAALSTPSAAVICFRRCIKKPGSHT